MKKPLKYTLSRVNGWWWDIYKGNELVGYVCGGSDFEFYAMHKEPLTSVGTGFKSHLDAFKAYVEKYPLK